MLRRSFIPLYLLPFFALFWVPDDTRAQSTCPPGPPGVTGQIIEEVVFELEVVEDVTEEIDQTVNSTLGRVLGAGKVFPNPQSLRSGFPPIFEITEDSGLVDLSEVPAVISGITDTLTQELTEEFPPPVCSTTSSSGFVDQDVEVLSSSTERIFNGSTFDTEETIDFEVCPGTIIIGELEDWPNLIVVQGTLIVTLITTTIETQFFTDIITRTVNLIDNYEAEVIMILECTAPVANIPALSGWGMAAAALVLGLAGYVAVRRRKARI